ncbi:MAG TPA: L,D-transpeptidase family protein [Patescibacteria group bacterium]|nr:L,D-transpeptidase family protein [Patescibacteria group bacterium]
MRAILIAAAWALVAGTVFAQPPEAVPATLTRPHIVAPGETLLDIARANGLGYVETIAANPTIDPWLPPEGQPVTLPAIHLPPDAPHRGIVINLGDMRLYYYRTNAEPLTFPIGIGRSAAALGPATTMVMAKRHWPVWHVPASILQEHPDLPDAVEPGPDNPLGEYSLDLRLPGILIHGTNRPYGIGRRVSHGCIHLYPEDIATLYPLVRVGTPVTVVVQTAKLGWLDGQLWLEVHPSGEQADALEEHQPMVPEAIPGLDLAIAAAAGDRLSTVDWSIVNRAVAERRSVPVRITTQP